MNTIGTAGLRAQLLPPPYREEFTKLLRAYVEARIEFMRAGIDDHQLDTANADASRIETQLWTLTRGMTAQDPSGVPTAPVIQSLNDMMNVNERRRAALDNHVPEPVIHLLFTVALGALGFIAYGYGLAGSHRLLSGRVCDFVGASQSSQLTRSPAVRSRRRAPSATRPHPTRASTADTPRQRSTRPQAPARRERHGLPPAPGPGHHSR